MRGEKSFINLIKTLPKLLMLEQTRGLLLTIVRQWGTKNVFAILFKTWKKTGLVNTLSSLLSFRLDKIMPNLFVSMWDSFGDREAIISGDRRFTFKEFEERVFRLANGLSELGLHPRDKFAELLYNGNEYFEAFFAGSFLGCPMPSLNWHMKEWELIEAINRASPKALIFDEEFTERIILIKDKLRTVEHFIVVGRKAPEGMIPYEELISKSSARMPETNFILALNPYTAGTTGVPKNVNYFDAWSWALSNAAEAPRASFQEYLRYLVMGFSFPFHFHGTEIRDRKTCNIRCLVCAPLYHAGVIVSWAPFILLGATVIPMRRFDPEQFLRIIEQERINWTFVSPTILERILALPDEVKIKYDLGSMCSLICAAAPCPPELKRDINEFFVRQGCSQEPFCEYYGSAETAITTILLPRDYIENPKRIASVGKPRCGQTKIFDDEKGQWCPPNKEGRLLTRTNITVSLRYAGTPQKLEGAFKVVDGKEWFDDGLFGYMDEDNFLYLTSREKEVIISGGVNIFPDEIEEAILKNPKVFDVGVIRAPDKDLGEVPAAVIQLKGGQSASKAEIIEHCEREGLYGFKVPRIVEFTDQLPRHIDGKLIKRELEEKYWSGMERRG